MPSEDDADITIVPFAPGNSRSGCPLGCLVKRRALNSTFGAFKRSSMARSKSVPVASYTRSTSGLAAASLHIGVNGLFFSVLVYRQWFELLFLSKL